jgi:hypothetical protein
LTCRTVRSGRVARGVGDVDVLEEAQRLDLVLRAVDQHAVVGVAFGQQQLAADHVVQRLGVADDVDALDVDARAFLDVEGDVDGVGLRVGGIARPTSTKAKPAAPAAKVRASVALSILSSS